MTVSPTAGWTPQMLVDMDDAGCSLGRFAPSDTPKHRQAGTAGCRGGLAGEEGRGGAGRESGQIEQGRGTARMRRCEQLANGSGLPCRRNCYGCREPKMPPPPPAPAYLGLDVGGVAAMGGVVSVAGLGASPCKTSIHTASSTHHARCHPAGVLTDAMAVVLCGGALSLPLGR